MDIEVNYDYETINEYLTEKNLGEFLKEFLPSSEIIHDKKVPNSNVSYRPDYRIENIKLIIEYNGHHHYTIPENILNDYKKREAYESMGYIVKSIPYWIQLRVNTIHYLFIDRIPNLDTSKLKDHTTFPMGFISKKCVLPSKFCELGIREMLRERKLWDEVHDKYYKYFDFTLINKILEKDSFYSVANETILPYFIDMWKSGYISGYNIDTTKYKGINKELEIFS